MAHRSNDDVGNCIDDRHGGPLPQPHASPDLAEVFLHEDFNSQELASNYESAEAAQTRLKDSNSHDMYISLHKK
eukprot:4847864-Karenia_brevis.AAC.1